MKLFMSWIGFCLLIWMVGCIIAANGLWFWWIFAIPIEATLAVMAGILIHEMYSGGGR